MKHLFYVAAAACILAACSNNETDGLDNNITPVNAVPIQLSQNVEGVTARGVIENNSDVTATVVTCNANGSADWSAFTPQLSNELAGGNDGKLQTWANVSTASFKAVENAGISLTTPLYYYTEDNTYLAAVAPAGTATSTAITIPTQDGEQDVMYASADAGAKPTVEISATNLAFTHKTTQLKFVLGKVNKNNDGDWAANIYIKDITVQKARIPASVTIASGDVNWTEEANLSVPGIASAMIPAHGSTVSAGRPVMVDASNEILLDVTLTIDGVDKSYKNIPVKNEGSNLQTIIGSSHLITLTVKEPVTASGESELSTTATVTPWTVGTPGSGTIQ